MLLIADGLHGLSWTVGLALLSRAARGARARLADPAAHAARRRGRGPGQPRAAAAPAGGIRQRGDGADRAAHREPGRPRDRARACSRRPGCRTGGPIAGRLRRCCWRAPRPSRGSRSSAACCRARSRCGCWRRWCARRCRRWSASAGCSRRPIEVFRRLVRTAGGTTPQQQAEAYEGRDHGHRRGGRARGPPRRAPGRHDRKGRGPRRAGGAQFHDAAHGHRRHRRRRDGRRGPRASRCGPAARGIRVCEGDVDHVVGVVHVKDLLKVAKEEPVRRVLRQPWFVPETKFCTELLKEFRAHRSHIAIVLDEYGGTAGLVSIEDVARADRRRLRRRVRCGRGARGAAGDRCAPCRRAGLAARRGDQTRASRWISRNRTTGTRSAA